MIVSNVKNLFGKIATIHTSSFKCVISTAKEGLFKKQSTVVIEGDYFQDRANSFPCAKIIYTPSLKSSDRLKLHDGLADQIDELGKQGLSLKSAIDLCFQELKGKGLVVETINLLSKEQTVDNSIDEITEEISSLKSEAQQPLKKHNLHGLKTDNNGNVTIDLTHEEKEAIENYCKVFEGYGVLKEHADEFHLGTIAYALSQYAREQIGLCDIKVSKDHCIPYIDKAVAAAVKAYSIYPLPIYLYDFACFSEMAGKQDLANQLFIEFLDKQQKYKPRQLDEPFLKHHNIDEALRDARARVAE